MTIEDNPKQAFAAYIQELERDYYPWYRASAARHAWAWGAGQLVALIAGILAAVLAAGASKEAFVSYECVRWALVLLPMLAATASSLLAQTRVRELLALRERGRETMQGLIARAKADYAAASDDEKRLSTMHRALVSRVSELERSQSAEFLTVAPGATGSTNQTGTARDETSGESKEG